MSPDPLPDGSPLHAVPGIRDLTKPRGFYRSPEVVRVLEQVERGEVTRGQAAAWLGVSTNAIKRAILKRLTRASRGKRHAPFTPDTSRRALARLRAQQAQGSEAAASPLAPVAPIADAAGRPPHELICERVPVALETLVMVMRTAPRAADRIRAAETILDHALGRPAPRATDGRDQAGAGMAWEAIIMAIRDGTATEH